MNTHDKAQELVGNLDDIKNLEYLSYREQENISKAIAAIYTLRFIAENGGTDDEETGLSCNGGWCAEQARSWLEAL